MKNVIAPEQLSENHFSAN